MENLTKENFWNQMQEEYPIAMESFCKWIDEYKEKNNWKELFNVVERHIQKNGADWEVQDTIAPKYHELPLAFQIGIFNQFCAEQEMPLEEYRGMQIKVIKSFLVYLD